MYASDSSFSQLENPAINRYIDFINGIPKVQSVKSKFYKYAEYLEKYILNGEVLCAGEIGQAIRYKDNLSIHPLQMKESSSSVRELAGFISYIKHIAKKGDLVFFDEPELSLHPDAIRHLLRVIVAMKKEGIKFFIITHSDYIIKEINNLIYMNNEKISLKFSELVERGFVNRLYEDQDITELNELLSLDYSTVNIYTFERSENQVSVSQSYGDNEGFMESQFNKVLVSLNNFEDALHDIKNEKKSD